MWQWKNQTPLDGSALAIASSNTGVWRTLLTRVVGNESDNEVAVRVHHERISTHWLCRKLVLRIRVIEALVWRCTVDSLEVVPVQMERMLSGIVVVQYDLDHVALLEHVTVGVVTIYRGIVRSITRAQHAV